MSQAGEAIDNRQSSIVNHQSHVAHHFDDAEQQYTAAGLGMWTFLATEVLFFGGLFTGYLVYRSRYSAAFAEGSSHLDLLPGTVNTAVLLISSLTMALAVHAAQTDERRGTVRYLLATIGLGLVFLGIKAYEYGHKAHEQLVPGRRFTMLHVLEQAAESDAIELGRVLEAGTGRLLIAGEGDGERLAFVVTDRTRVTLDGRAVAAAELPAGAWVRVAPAADRPSAAARVVAKSQQVELFFSFYFAMTGMHALHMVIGIPLLGTIAFLAHRGRFSSAWYTPVEITGLYWHFVDIVWVFLFPLLYLIS